MQNNMEIYEKYRKVPQNALKDFNNGRFKGTDINTMWRIKSLTEEFGMCGVGWYYDIVRLWTEDGADGQKISNAEIKLYVKVDGEWSKGISGVGGNMFVKNIYHAEDRIGMQSVRSSQRLYAVICAVYYAVSVNYKHFFHNFYLP